MTNQTILSRAADAVRSARYPARRLTIAYAAVACGIPLAVQLISYLLTRQMDSTGGLGGIGTRTVLSLIQTLVLFAGTAVMPFWNLGYTGATLRIARGELAAPPSLLSGFHRFFPLLRLMLLRALLIMLLAIAAMNAASMLYMLTPASLIVMEELESVLAVGETALADPAVVEQLLSLLWPLYLLLGLVLAALLIPISYRLRLTDLSVLDGNDRALPAMLISYRTMRGKCLQLFRLDLHFWYYYLLNALAGALAYGDMLLGLESDLAFWCFYCGSLLAQLAVTVFFAPKLHTACALFYDAVIQQESPKESSL